MPKYSLTLWIFHICISLSRGVFGTIFIFILPYTIGYHLVNAEIFFGGAPEEAFVALTALAIYLQGLTTGFRAAIRYLLKGISVPLDKVSMKVWMFRRVLEVVGVVLVLVIFTPIATISLPLFDQSMTGDLRFFLVCACVVLVLVIGTISALIDPCHVRPTGQPR